MQIGDKSPWGTIVSVETVAEGFSFVEAEEENGYVLSESRNKKVADVFREESCWYKNPWPATCVELTFIDELTDEHAYLVASYAQDMLEIGDEDSEEIQNLEDYFGDMIEEVVAETPHTITGYAIGDQSPWGEVIDVTSFHDNMAQEVTTETRRGYWLIESLNKDIRDEARAEDGLYAFSDNMWVFPIMYNWWMFPVNRVILAMHMIRSIDEETYASILQAVCEMEEVDIVEKMGEPDLGKLN